MHCIVEGIAGSGKSFYIKSKLNKFTLSPELAEQSIRLPPFTTDIEQVLKDDAYLITTDFSRYHLAKEPTIFDRWIFSTIAYAYARHQIHHVDDGSALHSLTHDKYMSAELVILSTPVQTCMERLRMLAQNNPEKYRSCLETPYTEEFYACMHEYFEMISKIKSDHLADYVLH